MRITNITVSTVYRIHGRHYMCYINENKNKMFLKYFQKVKLFYTHNSDLSEFLVPKNII